MSRPPPGVCYDRETLEDPMGREHEQQVETDIGAQSVTWEAPRFEVISLDCEITAYTPDDRPLF